MNKNHERMMMNEKKKLYIENSKIQMKYFTFNHAQNFPFI